MGEAETSKYNAARVSSPADPEKNPPEAWKMCVRCLFAFRILPLTRPKLPTSWVAGWLGGWPGHTE